MGSMGYCRFRNTVRDLEDCNQHIWDEELSEEEERARARLIRLCHEIAKDTADEYEEMQEAKLKSIMKLEGD